MLQQCCRAINANYSSDSEKPTETVKNAVVITSTNVAIKEKKMCDWKVSSDVEPLEVANFNIQLSLTMDITFPFFFYRFLNVRLKVT